MRMWWVRPDSDIPYKSFERHTSRVSAVTSHANVRTRVTSVSRSEYHADLKADLHSGLSRRLVLSAFIIVIGSSYLFGYNIAVLNQPKNVILDFYNSTYISRDDAREAGGLRFLWTLTAVMFIIGGIGGACLAGSLSDTLGRKRTMLVSHLFVVGGVVLSTSCVVARSPETLIIGRFLLGCHSGISNVVAPMYLTEIAPFSVRGAFGTLHQLAITTGIFFGSVLGLPQVLGTSSRWPYLFLVELLPAGICIAFIHFLPESPRYLLLIKRRREESEKAFQFYYGTDKVSPDMEELDTEHQDVSANEGPRVPVLNLLKSQCNWAPILIACSLQVIQQFSGINSIIFFSHHIFHAAGVPDYQIPLVVCGTNLVNVIMTMISVAAIDRFGRRLLLLLPMVVMMVDLVCITISINLQARVFWMAYISVICVITYVISFAVGLGPIPMMVGTELFRQRHRAAAMTLTGIVNWAATFVIAVAFEPLQQRTGTFTFIIFLVLMTLFTVFVYFKMPETRHKTIEEIVHQFSPGSEIDVEEAIGELPMESPDSSHNNRKDSNHSIGECQPQQNGSYKVNGVARNSDCPPECIELLEKSSNGHVIS